MGTKKAPKAKKVGTKKAPKAEKVRIVMTADNEALLTLVERGLVKFAERRIELLDKRKPSDLILDEIKELMFCNEIVERLNNWSSLLEMLEEADYEFFRDHE